MTGSPQRKYVQTNPTTAISPEGFNPNSPYYKTCCCHVKQCTIIVAIIEIFVVCFLIVAIIPDVSTKICQTNNDDYNSNSSLINSTIHPSNSTTNSNLKPSTTPKPIINLSTIPISSMNSTRRKRQSNFQNNTSTTLSSSSKMQQLSTTTVSPITSMQTINSFGLSFNLSLNDTFDDDVNDTRWYTDDNGENYSSLKLLYIISCKMNIIWLILALIHTLFLNIMLIGIKTVKWYLMLPNITSRIIVVLIILTFLFLLIIGILFNQSKTKINISIWILIITCLIFILPYSYIIYIQIKCTHFIKLSDDTGFSLTNTRPIGQTTSSLNEARLNQQQQQNIPMQELQNNSNTSENQLPPLRHTFR